MAGSTITAYFAPAALSNNSDKSPETEATSAALQLPTPIPSCPSDTSSCVENASASEESSQKPRASRRVTRASLRAVTVSPEDESQQSNGESLEGVNDYEEPGELSVENEGQASRSESGVDVPTEAPPSEQPQQNTNIEPRVTRRSSRFAGSNDVQSDSRVSSRQVSSKQQSEENKANDTEQVKEKKGKDDGQTTTRRRSARLTLLDKAGAAMGNATTVLGKRSRDAMQKGTDKVKDLGRRAGLRPRNATGEASASSKSDAPEAKKRRVSENDAAVKKKTDTEASVQPAKPPPKRKPKRWLSHGLYIGQHRNFDPRLTEAKNRARNAKDQALAPERSLLPLPMFAGERLLEQGRDFKLPFDIFCPLPGGQPKPDEWRKVNKNVFVGDASSIWRAANRSEMSTCMCTPETGCDEDCHNRYMFYECDDKNCKLGADVCKNRSFEGLRQRIKAGGKYNIGVEVIKTEDRGYGVRSNRTFEPYQIIVEYTGEILTQEEAENRMRKVYKNSECYYLMNFDQNMIIDATRGSMARFVNHSCEPNCTMEKWTVAGKPRMALFAGEKGIMTGEELTYDYNFDPFSQKNVQECRCGADSCRGFLGPKPKDAKCRDEGKNGTSAAASKPKAKTLIKQGPAGTKRKIDNVLDNKATTQLNKKRKTTVTSSVKAGVQKVVSKTTARGRAGADTSAKSKTKTATTATTTTSRKPRKTRQVLRKPAPQQKSSGTTRTRTLNRPSKPIVHSSTRSSRSTTRGPAALKRLMAASTGRASRRGK